MIKFRSFEIYRYLILSGIFLFYKNFILFDVMIYIENIFVKSEALSFFISDIIIFSIWFYFIKYTFVEVDIFKKLLILPNPVSKRKGELVINISEIKSIERIDSFYDKYTNKLNKLEIVFEGYNDVKFSTIENEKLIQTLLQLNPNIRIKKQRTC